MKNKNSVKKLLAGTLIISLSLSFYGCKKKKKQVAVDSGAYSSVTFDVPVKEGFSSMIRNIFPDGENICIPVEYSRNDEETGTFEQVTEIYTVDNEGKIMSTLSLPGVDTPIAVLEEGYAYVGVFDGGQDSGSERLDPERTIALLDKKTGKTVKTIETEFAPHFVIPISDGYVITGSASISRYAKDWSLVKTFQPGFSLFIDGENFFEDKGKFYAIEEKDMGRYVYHEVDFESGACPALAGNQDIGASGSDMSGKYFFNLDGEYKVDLGSMQVDFLADYNCIDIRPPKKSVNTPAKYFKLDDERFAITYEYVDLTSEVLLFKYDPTIDRSDVEQIKIGGFGVYSDETLRWAVYTFNTTQSEYRAILEDYGNRFEGTTPDDRRKATLNLTQYFNEGNAPDIFYGTRFDYEYMGRNGMVIDLSKYMQESDSSTSLTDAANRLMYDGSGACYQMFAGYTMDGFFIQDSVAAEVQDTSLFSLYQYAEEHEIPYSVSEASDIVDCAIRYNFAELWGAYDGNRKISHEDMVEIVSIVTGLPVSQRHFIDRRDVENGLALMCSETIWCSLNDGENTEEGFTYIGYPSVSGSVYLVRPESLLAISTTAKNKDACWKMLSTLLSEEAQKQVLCTGRIPVTKNMLNLFCDAAMHPDQISDEVIKSCFRRQKPVSQESVDQFLVEIGKADTVYTMDWGVFDIIYDEINTYYTQSRTPEQIAESLEKRLTLYMQENYQ